MNDYKNTNTVESTETAPISENGNDGTNTLTVTQNVTESTRSLYVHRFKTPFEYEDKVYTEITFDYRKLTGRDVLAIESELTAENRQAAVPEFSRAFQYKMAVRASGVASDVIEAMPIKDFNRIANSARSFLLFTDF